MKSVAALITLQLAGCGVYQRVQQTQANVEKNEASASTVLTQMRAGNASPDAVESVSAQAGFWAPSKPIDMAAQAEKLAADEALDNPVSMTLWQPDSLRDFSQMLSKIAGMPVQLAPDALALPAGENGSAVDTTVAAMKHKGPLRDLLDTVTSKLGLSWKIANGTITIFRFDTRIFALNTVCTSSNLNSTIVSGTTTSGSGNQNGGTNNIGNSSQSTEVSTKSDLCGDIHKTIAAMATPGSGRVFLSSATNALVVTDSPAALQRIGSYLEKQKHLFAKQVLFNIKVLSVHVDESDGLGFDLNAVRSTLIGKMGLNVAGGAALDQLKGAGSLGLNWAIGGAGDKTGAIIRALSTLGKVSEVTSPSITTLNMQPAPLQIGDQTTYLAKTSTTMSTQGNSQTDLQPGVVSSGFNMTLLPFVSETNEMILQYSLNISSLEKIENIEANKTKIQLPKVSNRIFNQSVRLQSGQTLVMGGFERTRDRSDARGTGYPWFPLLGGGVGQNKSRDIIVVLITPTVM